MLIKNQSSKVDDIHGLVKFFPKVTVIKVATKQNNFDSYLINKCQDMLNQDVQNVQLLELFSLNDSIAKSYLKGEKRVASFNLKEQFDISSPYGM